MIRFGKSIQQGIDGKTMTAAILPLAWAEIHDCGVVGVVGVVDKPHDDAGHRRFTPMSHVLALVELEAPPEAPF